MLELSNRKLENGEVVTAKGRLDATTSRLFDAHCRGLLHAGCQSMVFDFRELQFLSSDGLRTSNLGALINQLSAGKEEEPSGQDKPEEPPAGEEKPGKKVIIEKLSITGSRMNLSLTGAAALTGGGAIPIPLPPITLTDLGKESDGLTVTEAIQKILNAILDVATSAISGTGKLLGAGAGAVGEGAADAGKAVVNTAADAGKALGNAAADAGKAVGDALKNVNPFGK